MARIHAQEGDLAEAISFLATIPLTDPEFGLAAAGQQADYLSLLHRLNESIHLWQQMLANDDSLNIVRSRLATDLYASGRRIESGWHLQELADRGAASEDELRRLLNVTNSPKSLDELVQESKKSEQRQLGTGASTPIANALPMTLPQAWELIHQRRYRDAATVLESLHRKAPLTEVSTLLAFVQADLQRFDDARDTLATAASDAIRFAPYWIAVGDDWSHQGENGHAAAAYARAMLADSTWDLTHERLVGTLLRMGKVDQARLVDERRFDLIQPIEACIAVGKGQPDDVRAGNFLVQDLRRLGHMSQACGWMRHIVARNATAFGGGVASEALRRELLAVPKATIQSLLVAGIRMDELPDPTPVIRNAGSTHEPSITGSNVEFAGTSPPIFIDAAAQTGLDVTYHNLPVRKSKHLRLHEGLGSGVAALDFDRDGWTDLYFGQASGDPPRLSGTRANTLARKLDGKFQNVTMLAACDDRGYATGVSAGDWNQDGWDDILVGNFGRNRLFLNQGDGTFIDATDTSGLSTTTFTASVAFADVDSDGLADIVEINYVDDPAVLTPMIVQPDGIAENYPGPNQYRSGLDVVWLSQGDGTARPVPLAMSNEIRAATNAKTEPKQSTVASAPRIGDDANPGLGVLISNLDSAPGLEVFVANDARPNQLWNVTQVDGTVKLTQTAELSGLATSSHGRATACMGVASSDFNRDGLADLFVTNWFEEWVNLYVQRSPGVFQDSAPKFLLDACSDHQVGFGTQGIDYDNDGWFDIFVTNGHINDYEHLGQAQRMLPQLLINRHHYFEQANFSSSGTMSFWTTPHVGRCAITLDHNRDGRMDVVVTDLIDPVALLENETDTKCHFLQLRLVGTTSERNAIGTRIEILGSDPKQVAITTSGDGYFGRNEPIVHFGLGTNSKPVSIKVTWPDNSTQQFDGLAVDKRYLLTQANSEPSTL